MTPMRRFFLGFLLVALALPAAAQSLPRVKGRIASFDGLTFQLAPEDGAKPVTVRLQARTQFMASETRPRSAITTGAYVAVRVAAQDGALTAEEVQIYPAMLRGSGEGRLPQGNGRAVISGAVTASSAGSLTLFYRGGQMAAGTCIGRADPKRPSPVCTADPVIRLPENVKVRALVPGDRRLLTEGVTAIVSLETDAKGVRSTPGLILEKP